MDKKSKDLQLQYEGFLKTPFLWHGKGVFDLLQFDDSNSKELSFNSLITQKLRLGKLVERFVSFHLQQSSFIKVLTENLQIQEEKRTVGELDCILLKNDKPIHLEIIYKFYLYDSSVGKTEIEHWIGPNRRDSLIQKITKLKEKQLPLLYSQQCSTYLQELELDSKEIEQQVYFKAQLFVHLNNYKNEFPSINNKCITGFYIYANELEQFNDSKFHIPNKHNWLVEPYTNSNWLSYQSFITKLKIYLDEKKAPLCWLKKPNGELFKFFIVWW